MTDQEKVCYICNDPFTENETSLEKMITGCNHEFHMECWNKMFSTEEKRLSCKSNRIHLWLAMKCPECNERNFIDGNNISDDEYINLLIEEMSKQTKGYNKCVDEMETLEEKYALNNVKHKKIMENYNKMTEYIALKAITSEEKII